MSNAIQIQTRLSRNEVRYMLSCFNVTDYGCTTKYDNNGAKHSPPFLFLSGPSGQNPGFNKIGDIAQRLPKFERCFDIQCVTGDFPNVL